MTSAPHISDTATLTVLYFASVRELTGTSADTLVIYEKPVTVNLIKQAIIAKHGHTSLPSLLDSCMIAVDQEYIYDLAAPIDAAHSREIAVIPPISGG